MDEEILAPQPPVDGCGRGQDSAGAGSAPTCVSVGQHNGARGCDAALAGTPPPRACAMEDEEECLPPSYGTPPWKEMELLPSPQPCTQQEIGKEGEEELLRPTLLTTDAMEAITMVSRGAAGVEEDDGSGETVKRG